MIAYRTSTGKTVTAAPTVYSSDGTVIRKPVITAPAVQTSTPGALHVSPPSGTQPPQGSNAITTPLGQMASQCGICTQAGGFIEANALYIVLAAIALIVVGIIIMVMH